MSLKYGNQLIPFTDVYGMCDTDEANSQHLKRLSIDLSNGISAYGTKHFVDSLDKPIKSLIHNREVHSAHHDALLYGVMDQASSAKYSPIQSKAHSD